MHIYNKNKMTFLTIYLNCIYTCTHTLIFIYKVRKLFFLLLLLFYIHELRKLSKKREKR
jgi:hypothetical protein